MGVHLPFNEGLEVGIGRDQGAAGAAVLLAAWMPVVVAEVAWTVMPTKSGRTVG